MDRHITFGAIQALKFYLIPDLSVLDVVLQKRIRRNCTYKSLFFAHKCIRKGCDKYSNSNRARVRHLSDITNIYTSTQFGLHPLCPFGSFESLLSSLTDVLCPQKSINEWFQRINQGTIAWSRRGVASK